MDKKITDIQAEMDTAYQAAYGLDGTAMSNVSEWKIFRGVFAQLAFSIYMFFASYKDEVAALAASTEYGNESWWRNTMLDFQEGYSLTIIDGKAKYNVIDETAKIIKRVAVVEVYNAGGITVQLKIAKETAGVPGVISAPELVMIDSYVKARKPAGIQTQIISLDADEVKVTETIYYDGKLDLDTLKASVLAARKAYLTNIVFDGKFNINDYRLALRAVVGVLDADVAGVSIKNHGGSYTAVNRIYSPLSGYYKLIEADCLLTYIPV
jgi:hypothetical protein